MRLTIGEPLGQRRALRSAPSGSPAAVAAQCLGVSRPLPLGQRSASGSASGSASPAVAAAAVPPAASFANGPTAFFPLGDLATNPVDGTGAAINLNQTAAEAADVAELHAHRAGQPADRARAWPRRGSSATAARWPTPRTRAPSSRPRSSRRTGRWQVYNPLVVTAGHHTRRGAGRADDRRAAPR